MSESYIRTGHSESAVDSLNLPNNLTLAVFNIDNWKFVEMPLRGKQTYVYHLKAELKIPGYEDWIYDWVAEESDLYNYGGGTTEGWREYVRNSFAGVLNQKREHYLTKTTLDIKSAMKGFR